MLRIDTTLRRRGRRRAINSCSARFAGLITTKAFATSNSSTTPSLSPPSSLGSDKSSLMPVSSSKTLAFFAPNTPLAIDYGVCSAIPTLTRSVALLPGKYSGGMDQVDSIMISEADLAKWEKKCKSLKSEAASEESCRPLIGPSNDIHNELNSESINNFDKSTNSFLRSTFSNGVVPLQNYTNERDQVYQSEQSEVTEVGPLLHDANSYLPVRMQFDTNSWGLKDLTAYMDSQQSLVCNDGKCSTNGFLSHGGMYQAHPDERMVNGESSSQVLQNLTQISSVIEERAKGNVHSGAPPPWFDATEENLLNVRLKPGLGSSNIATSLNKSGKSQKLNPKRVGAAWAEKRKSELEMKKRGEIVANNFDSNWLPNFGRVWQSGSRKESRKEFEVENKNSLKAETQSETLMKIQPYVSKRMRTDVNK